MAGFWKHLIGGGAPDALNNPALAGLAREAAVLRIGGGPRHASRMASWWGGNFIVEPPEDGLVPLVQIAAADVGPALGELIGADYLLIWFDPARLAGPDPATAPVVATHAAPARPEILPPVEQLCRIAGAVACLPMFVERTLGLLPDEGDLAAKLPPGLDADPVQLEALAPAAPEDEEPVTLGGWPQWLGPSLWPGEAGFVAEIRSTEKGRFSCAEMGSLYLFRDGAEWIVRSDSF